MLSEAIDTSNLNSSRASYLYRKHHNPSYAYVRPIPENWKSEYATQLRLYENSSSGNQIYFPQAITNSLCPGTSDKLNEPLVETVFEVFGEMRHFTEAEQLEYRTMCAKDPTYKSGSFWD